MSIENQDWDVFLDPSAVPVSDTYTITVEDNGLAGCMETKTITPTCNPACTPITASVNNSPNLACGETNWSVELDDIAWWSSTTAAVTYTVEVWGNVLTPDADGVYTYASTSLVAADINIVSNDALCDPNTLQIEPPAVDECVCTWTLPVGAVLCSSDPVTPVTENQDLQHMPVGDCIDAASSCDYEVTLCGPLNGEPQNTSFKPLNEGLAQYCASWNLGLAPFNEIGANDFSISPILNGWVNEWLNLEWTCEDQGIIETCDLWIYYPASCSDLDFEIIGTAQENVSNSVSFDWKSQSEVARADTDPVLTIDWQVIQRNQWYTPSISWVLTYNVTITNFVWQETVCMWPVTVLDEDGNPPELPDPTTVVTENPPTDDDPVQCGDLQNEIMIWFDPALYTLNPGTLFCADGSDAEWLWWDDDYVSWSCVGMNDDPDEDPIYCTMQTPEASFTCEDLGILVPGTINTADLVTIVTNPWDANIDDIAISEVISYTSGGNSFGFVAGPIGTIHNISLTASKNGATITCGAAVEVISDPIDDDPVCGPYHLREWYASAIARSNNYATRGDTAEWWDYCDEGVFAYEGSDSTQVMKWSCTPTAGTPVQCVITQAQYPSCDALEATISSNLPVRVGDELTVSATSTSTNVEIISTNVYINNESKWASPVIIDEQWEISVEIGIQNVTTGIEKQATCLYNTNVISLEPILVNKTYWSSKKVDDDTNDDDTNDDDTNDDDTNDDDTNDDDTNDDDTNDDGTNDDDTIIEMPDPDLSPDEWNDSESCYEDPSDPNSCPSWISFTNGNADLVLLQQEVCPFQWQANNGQTFDPLSKITNEALAKIWARMSALQVWVYAGGDQVQVHAWGMVDEWIILSSLASNLTANPSANATPNDIYTVLQGVMWYHNVNQLVIDAVLADRNGMWPTPPTMTRWASINYLMITLEAIQQFGQAEQCGGWSGMPLFDSAPVVTETTVSVSAFDLQNLPLNDLIEVLTQ